MRLSGKSAANMALALGLVASALPLAIAVLGLLRVIPLVETFLSGGSAMLSLAFVTTIFGIAVFWRQANVAGRQRALFGIVGGGIGVGACLSLFISIELWNLLWQWLEREFRFF